MKRRRARRLARFRKGWRQLYGDFDRLGVSVEWHDFQTERPLDWGLSFHPRSVEFCLNVEGRGAVGDRGPGDYCPGQRRLLRAHGSAVAGLAPGEGIIISSSRWSFRASICRSSWPIAKRISIRSCAPRFFPGKSDRLSPPRVRCRPSNTM